MKYLIIFIFFLVSADPGFAFGNKAHRVISEIAENHLTVEARTAIENILGEESLSASSTWADEMRYSQDDSEFWSYDYSSNWHFVNIDAGQSYAQSKKNKKGDAYTALLSFIQVLENLQVTSSIIDEGIQHYLNEINVKNSSLAEKRLALKFIIHLVADLHQPLHVGYEEDQGGNQIDVLWFTQKTNLHSVWDSRLINVQDLSVRAWENKLEKMITALKASELSRIKQSKPMDWINEGLILREDIYNVERFGGRLDNEYANEYKDVVEDRILKASLRLAALLNSIFKP